VHKILIFEIAEIVFITGQMLFLIPIWLPLLKNFLEIQPHLRVFLLTDRQTNKAYNLLS